MCARLIAGHSCCTRVCCTNSLTLLESVGVDFLLLIIIIRYKGHGLTSGLRVSLVFVL